MFRITVRILLPLSLLTGLTITFYYGYPFSIKDHSAFLQKEGEGSAELAKLHGYGSKAKLFCKEKGFNTATCFLIDMGLPAGKNRFFVYDMLKDSIISDGIVAHGSCNHIFMDTPEFSNEPGCGCSSLGKYKIGYKYNGNFGTAYKLYGLDSSNNNAFKRNIVLHSYYQVPDKEVDPLPVCNSLGCAMVSNNYLKLLTVKIDASAKPVLLWIFE
ncbi:MAG TPA: murein L,D-transpeptidase catalytic domain family protein [Panacibacter sp.]|nr:murein L,D-transpeptidase catalytic domain family protein [Panacibacter sp.]